jgi:hypothetical protein
VGALPRASTEFGLVAEFELVVSVGFGYQGFGYQWSMERSLYRKWVEKSGGQADQC